MMSRMTLALVVVYCTGVAVAKDRPRINIQVVDTQTSVRQHSYTVPGTNAHSTTDCDTNATGTDYGTGTININGTTTCSTTTTPGTPPTTRVKSIPQAHVHAIMPEGTHVTLWCQAGFRHCSTLSPGNYSAEVKGNTAWVYTHDLSGKEQKVKYHAVGGW